MCRPTAAAGYDGDAADGQAIGAGPDFDVSQAAPPSPFAPPVETDASHADSPDAAD